MDSQNPPQENLVTLSEAESAEVMVDISSLVFESALGRLLLTLEEEALTELEQYLTKDHEPEQLVKYLLEKYPNLQQLIDEEAEALEEKAKTLNS